MEGSPVRDSVSSWEEFSDSVVYGSSAASIAEVKSERRRPGWLSWRARVIASR